MYADSYVGWFWKVFKFCLKSSLFWKIKITFRLIESQSMCSLLSLWLDQLWLLLAIHITYNCFEFSPLPHCLPHAASMIYFMIWSQGHMITRTQRLFGYKCRMIFKEGFLEGRTVLLCLQKFYELSAKWLYSFPFLCILALRIRKFFLLKRICAL